MWGNFQNTAEKHEDPPNRATCCLSFYNRERVTLRVSDLGSLSVSFTTPVTVFGSVCSLTSPLQWSCLSLYLSHSFLRASPWPCHYQHSHRNASITNSSSLTTTLTLSAHSSHTRQSSSLKPPISQTHYHSLSTLPHFHFLSNLHSFISICAQLKFHCQSFIPLPTILAKHNFSPAHIQLKMGREKTKPCLTSVIAGEPLANQQPQCPCFQS